jgi:hypothetical protein
MMVFLLSLEKVNCFHHISFSLIGMDKKPNLNNFVNYAA